MAINPVWDFTKQPNKYGYVNCLRWTLTEEAKGFSRHHQLPINPKTHTPCGHWHTPEVVEELPECD